jgi:23S rRNA (cytosine1962-C5)-methyltransferase
VAFERLSRPLRDARILHHAEGLLVVDKPSGIPVHGGDEALAGDLVTRLATWLASRGEDDYVGVHQRLDEGTSGVLLFTTARERNAEIARIQAEHELGRGYVAGVGLRSPRLLSRLERGPVQFSHRLLVEKGRTRVVESGGVEATTEVALQERAGERALLRLSPRTGRTHQLRVELSHEGAPIAGDALYGGEPASRLLLHAEQLTLKQQTFRATLPALFGAWLAGSDGALGDAPGLAAALEDAALLRAPLAAVGDVYRLANEHGDQLPGVTVDRYGDYAVLALSTREAEARVAELSGCLLELGARGVYLKIRVKGDARKTGTLANAPETPIAGEAAPERFVVNEHDMKIWVELGRGMSTGLFLDQRDNRRRLRERVHGARVLNLFSYTSSFGVAAALGGARHVTSVDVSRRPLEIARENFTLNGIDPARHAFLQRDALAFLQRARRDGERFDCIVLDPPSFATSAGGAAFNVVKRYGVLAEHALSLLAPGGALFSVTNHRGTALGRLRRTLREAAGAAGVGVAQLKDLPSQLDCPDGPDGPVPSKSVLVTLR